MHQRALGETKTEKLHLEQILWNFLRMTHFLETSV